MPYMDFSQIRLDRPSGFAADKTMRNGDFTRAIALTFGTDLSQVQQTCREIREAGMLTTGARGKHAPHMTPVDAARMAIAALAGSTPTTAVEVVRYWSNFRVRSARAEPQDAACGPFVASLPEHDCTLLDALTAIFRVYGDAEALAAHAWECGSQPMAPDIEVKASERPRSVTIREGQISVVFTDTEAEAALAASADRQKAELARAYHAAETGNPEGLELAEAGISDAIAEGDRAASRMLSGKGGLRITRTLTQDEIIPIALALNDKGGA